MEFKNYTILIIEDDEIILDIFSRIFKSEFNVISCPTVESYYQALYKYKVDLFVMDMALGSIKNGLDLIKELRDSDEHKTTPIVVVSAYAYIRDERIALKAGADKYIRKPIENKYLVNEVKRLLLDKIHLN